eukprot:9475946-Pyramimonas_sp.AAC.1
MAQCGKAVSHAKRFAPTLDASGRGLARVNRVSLAARQPPPNQRVVFAANLKKGAARAQYAEVSGSQKRNLVLIGGRG